MIPSFIRYTKRPERHWCLEIPLLSSSSPTRPKQNLHSFSVAFPLSLLQTTVGKKEIQNVLQILKKLCFDISLYSKK